MFSFHVEAIHINVIPEDLKMAIEDLRAALAENTEATNTLVTVLEVEIPQINEKVAGLESTIITLTDKLAAAENIDVSAELQLLAANTAALRNSTGKISEIVPDPVVTPEDPAEDQPVE